VHRFTKPVALLPGVFVAALAFAWTPQAGVLADDNDTLFVSAAGAPAHEGESCTTAKYSTIGAAVAAAHSGDTIHVCKGTYTEMVVVTKELKLIGFDATVDASGNVNGIRIGNLPPGPSGSGSGSEVRGFTVKNGLGEGILAVRVSDVTIEKNTVVNNDQGTTVTNAYPECQAHGPVPGDCGEGLHLMSARESTVWGNDVEHNAGGVLVSDEFGPANANVIAENVVSNNVPDCGITVVAHNTNAVKNGKRQPKVAGVYDNVIKENTVENNGEGGVLMGGVGPGAGVYDNKVTGNTLKNNGFAGFTLHDHTPGQDFNGNEIENNRIDTSNVSGDPDFGVTQTTGILIGSVADPVHIEIEDNHISNNHFGIWTMNVPASSFSDNRFTNVDIPVKQL
jgi:Right handed beta helix region